MDDGYYFPYLDRKITAIWKKLPTQFSVKQLADELLDKKEREILTSPEEKGFHERLRRAMKRFEVTEDVLIEKITSPESLPTNTYTKN